MPNDRISPSVHLLLIAERILLYNIYNIFYVFYWMGSRSCALRIFGGEYYLALMLLVVEMR